MDSIVSIEQEREQVNVGKPHVVVLGAGASRAAAPNGDAKGRPLPVMADLVGILDLGTLLESAGVGPTTGFERAYSQIAAAGKDAIRLEIEERVHTYFSALELPAIPTIYDYLVLGLREKDVIATFNWDPFLIQAVRRNRRVHDRLPTLIFLHGNVLMGYCDRDHVHGMIGLDCPDCGELFRPSPLLYPIEQKGYAAVPAISSAWEELQRALKAAFWVTIFGYSAPATDVEARALMQSAWGEWRDRQFEHFEFIDIRPEDELLESWSDFVHTHHYEVHSHFAESWIANHPRRTGEAYWNQYLQAQFIEPNPIPLDLDLDGLAEWLDPYLAVEDRADADV